MLLLQPVSGTADQALRHLPVGTVTVGREATSDIVLTDKGSSRNHAKLVVLALDQSQAVDAVNVEIQGEQ